MSVRTFRRSDDLAIKPRRGLAETFPKRVMILKCTAIIYQSQIEYLRRYSIVRARERGTKKGDGEGRETRNCVAYDNIIIISLIGTHSHTGLVAL